MQDNQLTVLTDAHRYVMRFLERRGVGIMEEIPFPPYTVDLYLPDYHVGIEVDGPQHQQRRDKKRDRILLDEYKLFIFRIKTLDIGHPSEWVHNLQVFLKEALDTREERWKVSKLKTPWL